MRSGHIPGSASLPYTELLNADGTFRPVASCAPGSPQAGVDGSRPVVTSCGSGVTACILTLGLRLAGLPEGAVYDGSWTEWGGRADTPVETGLSMTDTPKRGFRTTLSHTGRAGKHDARLRQSAAACAAPRCCMPTVADRSAMAGTARRARADLRPGRQRRRTGRWRT